MLNVSLEALGLLRYDSLSDKSAFCLRGGGGRGGL